MPIDDTRTFLPLNIAILTVSDSRTRANDTSGDVLAERIAGAGHNLAARMIVLDDIDEIVTCLKKWIADRQIDQGGFTAGREIRSNGAFDLGWDRDCITGYNIIEAEDMDEAEKLALGNPFISSIRIYEIR